MASGSEKTRRRGDETSLEGPFREIAMHWRFATMTCITSLASVVFFEADWDKAYQFSRPINGDIINGRAAYWGPVPWAALENCSGLRATVEQEAWMLDQPISEAIRYMKQREIDDGFCFFPSQALGFCSWAKRKRNWTKSSRTGAAIMTLQTVVSPIKNSVISTAAGVAAASAEMCQRNGFFDIEPEQKERLLNNFDAMREYTEPICDSLKGYWDNTTFYEVSHLFLGPKPEVYRDFWRSKYTPQRLRPALVTESDARKVAAYMCALGDLGCFAHFCLDHFCRLPSGLIGAGCQCRPDYSLLPLPEEVLKTAGELREGDNLYGYDFTRPSCIEDVVPVEHGQQGY